jgi:hypothetical protein
MHYKRKSEARSRNHFCRGKAINISHSEFVSVTFSHPACKVHAPCVTVPSVTCLALPYFSALSKKRHDFGEKVIEYKICIWIFSTTLPKAFLIFRIIQRDMITNVKTSSCEVFLILLRF